MKKVIFSAIDPAGSTDVFDSGNGSDGRGIANVIGCWRWYRASLRVPCVCLFSGSKISIGRSKSTKRQLNVAVTNKRQSRLSFCFRSMAAFADFGRSRESTEETYLFLPDRRVYLYEATFRRKSECN